MSITVLTGRLTDNAYIFRHRDLAEVGGERVFPSRAQLSTYRSTAITPSTDGFQGSFGLLEAQIDASDRLVTKEVRIPSGLSGIYTFRELVTRELRTAFFVEGSNVCMLGSPLMNPDGTTLAGAALNITYILQSLR